MTLYDQVLGSIKQVCDAADQSVADLQAENAQVTSDNSTLRDQVNSSQSQVDQLTTDNANLKSTNDAQASQITNLKSTNDAQASQITALQAQVADLQKQLGTVKHTNVGACPAAGGESLTAAQTVITKWGSGSAVRQFRSAFANPNTDPSFGIVHSSYKQGGDMAGVTSGKYDAQITAAAKAARPGDVLDFYHEPEDQISSGTFTLAAYTAARNHFYDVVKAANPQAQVCLTLMGWTFAKASGRNPEDYTPIKKDLIGVDLDGVNPKGTVYPDYTEDVTNVTAYASKHSIGWCVPEFGAPRATTGDTDGSIRGQWVTDWGNKIKAAGAVYVCYFDYPAGMTYTLTTAAEIAAWKAIVTG